MRVLKEGHRYELPAFDNPESTSDKQTLQFVEKAPKPNSTELELIQDGTTNEDVLEVLINRMNYLQSKFPCRENALAITNLQQALMWLEHRTKDRVNRKVEGKHQV